MTSLRRHVVTVVAVLLALAVGIALGAGPLAGSSVDEAGPSVSGTDPSERPADRVGTDPGERPEDWVGTEQGDEAGSSEEGSGSDSQTVSETLGGDAGDAGDAGESTGQDGAEATEAAGVAEEAQSAWAEELAAQAAARLYAGTLSIAPVALVAMPGADGDLVKAASEQVKAAGGRITGRYVLRPALLEPGQEPSVESLGAQLAGQVTAAGLDPAAPTWVRMGQLIGAAAANTEHGVAPPDQTSLTIRRSLGQAGLVSSPKVPVADAPLVMVVLGPEDDMSSASATISTSLLTGLAGTAVGVVVLGGEASAESGTLAGLRATTTPGVLATVDDADTSLAAVSATLAMIGVLGGRGGAYGPASPDGAVPLG